MLVGTVDRNVPGTTLQMAEFWWMEQPATLVMDIALIRSATHITPGFLINFLPIPSRAQTNYAFTNQEVVSSSLKFKNTGVMFLLCTSMTQTDNFYYFFKDFDRMGT